MELEAQRAGALTAMGGLGKLHGLFAQGTIPGHEPPCKGTLASWSGPTPHPDLCEASQGGCGVLHHPKRYRLLPATGGQSRGDLFRFEGDKAPSLTSCQGDAVSETRHLEYWQLPQT